MFGAYGTIASLYYPTDLKTFKTRNFAFIRYLDESSAIAAAENLQGMPLGELVNGLLPNGLFKLFKRILHPLFHFFSCLFFLYTFLFKLVIYPYFISVMNISFIFFICCEQLWIGGGASEIFISMCEPSRYFSINKGPANFVPKTRKTTAVKFEISS